MRRTIGVDEKLPLLQTLPLSFQHLTAMFGATILVPILFGVDPAIALLMNGIGTMLYSYITKGKIPMYLGSSFAFISPVLLVIEQYGDYSYAQSGFLFLGVLYLVLSLIIRSVGTRWLDIALPPPVVGAVIATIGIELGPVAAEQAGLLGGKSADVIIVAMFTLAVAVIGSLLFRGFIQVIPILIAVVAGYIFSCFMGMVDFSVIASAPWFKLPTFTAPKFDINAMLIIAPACLVVIAEHIGDLMVTGNVIGKNVIKDPGLHRSFLAEGLSNLMSGLVGSPPNTSYGENIGVMAITKVFSVWVIRGAAILAIIFSLIGKISIVIQTIPSAVMGGMTLYLYGVIIISGIRMLVEQQVDYAKNYNLALGAITFLVGTCGATVTIGAVSVSGMVLAAVVGMILSLIIYAFSKLGLLNEEYKIKYRDEIDQSHKNEDTKNINN